VKTARLVIATGNQGKAKEFRALLGEHIHIETLADHPQLEMPPETAETFEENAVVKARFVTDALGVATLADDSGLVVDALDGAPGVRSARYVDGTDQDRYLALLKALEGVEPGRRTARFICAMAFVPVDGDPVNARGACEGAILEVPAGEGGFGYDPVFQPKGRECAMAELGLAEKSAISHRGKAVQTILCHLQTYFSLELGFTKP